MLKDFKLLKKYFIENLMALILGLSCLLVVDFLQLLIPRIIKKSIDTLTTGKADSIVLFKYGLIIVGIAIAMAIFRYIWRYLLFGQSRKIEEALRNRIYAHLQSLSMSFYWRTKTGDIMARAVNDVDAIRMATGMGLVALTDGIVLGMATICFMLYINVKLTLISLIPTPFILYFTFTITKKMGGQFRNVQQTFSELTESAREAFAGIRVIKAYNRQSWVHDRLKKSGDVYVNNNLDLAKTLALFYPVMALFTNLGLVAVIWIGGRLTIFGDITTGDFVAFISYLNLMTWPIMALGWITNLMQRGSASMKRINGILNEAPEITDQVNPYKGDIRGEICFKGLTFYYPNEKNPALEEVELTIEPGKTVAIVGGVGSGKSTLLQIIPRLIETEKGMVQIDGIPIHDIELKHLRESIGFVTQETHIFSDTILNNISFGRQDVSAGLIDNVLEVSQLKADIGSFPAGVNSLLGERGITLSGGQRQRLTIARALISKPPILILDDALSQVDTRTESTILNKILDIRKGETNIIVSHRLSTIKMADTIYVLKDGKLVEEGNYASLLAAHKEYARLYEKQQLREALERGI
jgi:ATP-binding cassette subfamily B protein